MPLIPQLVQVLNAHHRDLELPPFVFYIKMPDVKPDNFDGGTLWQSFRQLITIEGAADLRHLAHVTDSSL